MPQYKPSQSPTLEVVHRVGKAVQTKTIHPLQLEETCSTAAINIIHGNADAIRECPESRSHVSNYFDIPPVFWSLACRRANSYFGCEDIFDSDGGCIGHKTWTRFLVKQVLDRPGMDNKNYVWYKINILTKWTRGSKMSIMVFDAPSVVKARYGAPILESISSRELVDPYWFHIKVFNDVVQLQDVSVWAIRDLVRDTESCRPSSTKPNPDYPRLHDIARHAIHVHETLDTALTTISNILLEQERFLNVHPAGKSQAEALLKQQGQQLRFFDQMLRGLKARSRSNIERLKNEINLEFNIVAQHDSRISVQIGQAARVDSSAMRTIAFLTLAFLPATFISSIFSTSFFNFNPSASGTAAWQMSDKFWIFWAFSIPLTVVTLMLWSFWHLAFPEKATGADDAQGSNVFVLNILPRAMTSKLREILK